jgi:ribosome maturation factor RimP
MGSPVTLKTYKPRDGRKEFAGTLKGYDSGAVTIAVGDSELRFEKEEIALVRLRVEF